MEIDSLTTLIVNNGVAVAVIAYFMFRDYRFMDELQRTLQSLVDTVDVLKSIIPNSETNEDV